MTADEQAIVDEVIHRLTRLKETCQIAHDENAHISIIWLYGIAKDLTKALTKL